MQTKKNELGKVYAIRHSLLGLIIWGAYARFYETATGSEKKRQKGKQKKEIGQTTKDLLEDVRQYFIEKTSDFQDENKNSHAHEKSSANESKSISHEKYLQINPKDPTEVMRFIHSRDGSVIKEKSFSNMRTFFEDELIHRSPDDNIEVEMPREHLELLCLYGHNQTYEQLQSAINPCMILAQEIRYIHAKLGKLFESTVQNFLKGLQQVNENCNSNAIKKWVCDMIDRETNHITEGLTFGYYPVNTEIYLDELTSLMKSCSRGFGVNITQWNKHWHETAGKDILQINKTQAEGCSDIPAFRYIRIFLVEGRERKILNEDEEAIIKEQLRYKVKVYIIAHEAWQEFQKEIERFDFAVLRVGDSPMLLRSKFDGKTSGIFYTHKEQAKKEFSASLQKLLTVEKGKHIYMPREVKNKIIVGDPIEASGITELNAELFAIYTDKNLKS